MQINLSFVANSSGQTAPPNFQAAIQAAAAILDNTFVDDITVNLQIGYGEVGPSGSTQTLTGGAAAAGPASNPANAYSYSAIRTLLAGDLAPAAQPGVANLPAVLSGHSSVIVWSAEEKALGLLSATNGAIDGYVGFAKDIDPTLLTGVALHELTHAMGRLSSDSASEADVFDLDRFTSDGTRLFGDPQTAPPAYFSLDGGATALAHYSETSDASDFSDNGSTTNDAFAESYGRSTLQSLTSLDLLQMEALGFHASVQSAQQAHLFSASDVVFRRTSTGDWGYMTPHSGGGETWTSVGPSSVSYTGVGAGDFNGDGQRDVAFLNTTTGDWGFLTPASSGGAETWHDVGPTSTAYSVVAAADFNNDGATDVAFRNTTTGDMGFMSVTPAGGEIWHPVGATSIAYVPMGAGDFNGDGVMDIAFRSASTGEWGFMSVTAGGETWHDVGPTSLAYVPIGVGDFDGQGHAEVAFRNIATGDWGYMAANASGGETWHPVGPTSTAYNAVQSADFSGDGHSAIAFVNPTTGDFGYMEANIGGGETWHAAGSTSTDYYVLS